MALVWTGTFRPHARHAPATAHLPGAPCEIEHVADQLGHMADAAPDQPHKGRALRAEDLLHQHSGAGIAGASALRRLRPGTAMTCLRNSETPRSFERKWLAPLTPIAGMDDPGVGD